MATNLHLAPPAKTVDGLLAVPIDIQTLTGTLLLDGATSTGSADATITFLTGAQNGCPIFDLRQTITAAWLDGAAISVTSLAHHDFGGGPQAQLRVVNTVLPANTTHTLRVTYSLGLPQASTAGSYPPQLAWAAGPRLTFSFGFTDLGAGRYLEAWLPANLIYDQFACTLTVRVLNTAVPHSIITNGSTTVLGANHWQVTFPARFTALSHLLEVRATNTVVTQSASVLLPVSGTTVVLEAWKLQTGSADLTTQLNLLKTYLTTNETKVGPYLHGNRFVAFLHVGGMEYDGGTTTSTGALSHEVFHSWWARGLKPASQPDAWWDEAWTTYFNDNGGTQSVPFDFTKPPIELRSSNPYARITAGNAYTDGNKFWQGVSALLGNAALLGYMKDFYQLRKGELVRTTDLEEYLLCRSGNARLVDAFHRFVYGFADPAAVPDLWLKDDALDTAGHNDWNGRFWDSPDVWVRNQDDGGTTHQAPEYGQDNWFYARVRNRGSVTARHFVVSFHVKQFAGTQFTYPADFLPCVAAASGFELAPGSNAIVKARWPRHLVPAAGTHACLTAAVLCRGDQPGSGKHVWQHNNLAQKNLTVVDLKLNGFLVLPFVAANFVTQQLQLREFSLEVFRPATLPDFRVSLLHEQPSLFKGFELQRPFQLPGRLTDAASATASHPLDCGGHTPQPNRQHHMLTDEHLLATAPTLTDQTQELRFKAGTLASMRFELAGGNQLLTQLRLALPPTARVGQQLRLDVVQRDTKTQQITGGIAVLVRVVP